MSSNDRSAARYQVAVQRALYALLSIAAAVSVFRGVENAVANSQDLQWGTLVLFWRDHRDPYQVLLQSPSTTKVPIGAYLHFHFFLFAPLAWMSFANAKIAWAALNVVVGGATLWIFHRHKDVRMPLGLALLFLCATPARSAFGNGQISLVCLFFFALYVKYADRRPLLAAVLASLGTVKYNLGAPLFFQMRLTPLNVAAFIAVPLAAVLYWSLHFELSFWETLFQPVNVATVTVGPRLGVGDFLMLVRDAGLPALIAYAAAAAVLVLVMVLQKVFLPTEDRVLCFAFYAMLSLWSVYHGIYDFVFLLPVALVAVRSKNKIVQSGLLAGTAYFWFAMKLLEESLSMAPPFQFNLAVLMIMQGLVAWEIRVNAAEAKPAMEARPVSA